MDKLLQEQPVAKIQDDGKITWDYVIDNYLATRNHVYADKIAEMMGERNQFGVLKHKTALRPNNGRNSLADAIQELLDAICYNQNAILEGKDIDGHLKGVQEKLFECLETVYMISLENNGG